MSARLLLISDLHLDASRPDITASLLSFLQANQGRCASLFILGDLFEAWIGDDEVTDLSLEVAAALAAFSAAGSEVFLMHGNRDFLLGADYAARCGAEIISDPYLLRTEHESLLLAHGDQLCTDDTDYQKFRAMVRQSDWQKEFLAQPLAERKAFAEKARQQSQAATANKTQAIMDVNQQAVTNLLQEQQQVILLHGHTHRPALHDIELTQPIQGVSQARRIVLGDWDTQGWFVEIDEAGIRLEHFPLQV